ncbi:hypothetical protein AB0J47_42090 [Nocardia sp. NPDC049737]|uniref:hypothetical protein n=1 Tax=Nocardia sp. NPDC049737 TaxID=3154358 RepID=UPI00342697D1
MTNDAESVGYRLTLVAEPGDRRARAAVRVLADLSDLPAPDTEIVNVRIQIPEFSDGAVSFRNVLDITEPLHVARASVTSWRDQIEEVGR